MKPLVSVICLCYQHEKFVRKALESVIFQSYPHFEIIIVEDGGNDRSATIIRKFIEEIPAYFTEGQKKIPDIRFIQNPQNLGNCRSFNLAFRQAKGKYVVDFATDDLMPDDRIEKQVEVFEQLDQSYAVVYGNAILMNESGQMIAYHFPVDKNHQARHSIPQGQVYQNVLQSYFISSPTMMMRREVLEELGGYDEQLSYEDFDFCVRVSRKYLFYYLDEVLIWHRMHAASHSASFYRRGHNPHLISTLKVFEKAIQMNQNTEENQALAKNIFYHLRLAFYTENFDLVGRFAGLLKRLQPLPQPVFILLKLARWKVPLYWLYRIYLKIRYKERAY